MSTHDSSQEEEQKCLTAFVSYNGNPKCLEETTAGTPCQNPAIAGVGVCHSHIENAFPD